MGCTPTFHKGGEVTFFQATSTAQRITIATQRDSELCRALAQVTPVAVIAEGVAFEQMHWEFFGDSYYHPAHPDDADGLARHFQSDPARKQEQQAAQHEHYVRTAWPHATRDGVGASKACGPSLSPTSL